MTVAECPLCGRQFHLVANAPKSKKRRRWPWRWLDSDADATFDAPAKQHFNQSVAQTQPWRDAQPQPRESLGAGETVWRRLDMNDIRDPAILGAVGVGMPVAATTLIVGSVVVWPLSLWATIPIGAVLVGADIVFWVMVWPHIKHEDKHLITRERAQEVEDSKVNAPQKQERTVEVIVKAGTNKRHDKRAEFTDDTKFHNLAMKILGGASATEATAKACGISRARWIKIRDIFLDRGWASWRDANNTNLGIEMSRAGRAALRGCLPRPGGTSD